MQWVLVAVTVVLDMSCNVGASLLAMNPSAPRGARLPRVIVDDHRELARSYRKGGD
ncbi:hypothetical protein D9M71_137450 [compost metagenome]